MTRNPSNDSRPLALSLGLGLVLALGACGPKDSPDAKAAPAPAEKAASSAEAPAKAPQGRPAASPAPPADPAVLADPAGLTEQAPEEFKARFVTTKGDFVVEVHRSWAPHGADRFYNLVKSGYFDDTAFFRVVSGFMAQFGIHGQPAIAGEWRAAQIPDDPVVQSNTRGMVSFATSGPNSRTTQLFINFGDNSRLDGMGFSPFGRVDEQGMKVVDALYSGYGEGAPRGRGPNQGLIQAQGNAYLRAQFPELDYVVQARLVE